MAIETAQTLREKLTFEQQARFDALYAQRAKKVGTATVLSLPLLGTFGIEHFYLGNAVRGVLSVLFSWTLIPTIVALFDLIRGDVKRQVAHANNRVAQRVYTNVLANTVKTEDIPAAAAPVVAAPVLPTPASTPEPVIAAPSETVVVTEAVAVPAATAVAPADSIADVAPAQETVVADAQEADQTTVTTGSFTATESAATWEAGMAAPVTQSDSQTVAFGDATTTEADAASAVVETAPAVTEDGTESVVVDDLPMTSDDDILAADGVLAFVADPETPTADVMEAVQVDQTQQEAYQTTITEADHVATQHYHDGKLVSADRADATLTGEINQLITDHTSETAVVETTTPDMAHTSWVDVSPLQETTASPAPVASGAVTPDVATSSGGGSGGTDNPGGGLGDGGGTDTPGGGLGNGGGDTPGGGLGGGTDTPPPTPGHNPDAPIAF